jgi:ABC-type branched-subunit amino acid transport system permease subunit
MAHAILAILLASAIAATLTHVVSPELSFQFALLPALGGLGTAIGPVLGSIAITPLSEMLRSYFGGDAAGLHLATPVFRRAASL